MICSLLSTVVRYVEKELLGMKSLFEDKEACLRLEFQEEKEKLAQKASGLRRQAEEASAEKVTAQVCTAVGEDEVYDWQGHKAGPLGGSSGPWKQHAGILEGW